MSSTFFKNSTLERAILSKNPGGFCESPQAASLWGARLSLKWQIRRLPHIHQYYPVPVRIREIAWQPVEAVSQPAMIGVGIMTKGNTPSRWTRTRW